MSATPLAAAPRGPSSIHRRIEDYLAPVLILVAVMLLSLDLGTDDNWDLRNYHIYNPFAFFNKAPGIDIAPAQLQSFLSPTIDLVPYGLRLWLNEFPKTLCLVFALPTAIAAILAFRIGLLLVRPAPEERFVTARWLVVLLALLIGLTGAANLLMVGSSLSEMPAACFALGALLIIVANVDAPQPVLYRTLIAGLLAGVAIGIKLTMASFGAAAGIALVVGMAGPAKPRLMHLVSFGLGGLVGSLVVGGPWWLHLYRETGSPVFPFFNALFQSPLFDPINVSDDRFRPTTWMEKLFFPFFWAFSPNIKNSELPFRDPRMAIAYVAILITLVMSVLRLATKPEAVSAIHRRTLCFALFVAISFVLWEYQFSIFRYLATIELVCGFALLSLMSPLLQRRSTQWLPTAVLACVLVACAGFTIYPHLRTPPPWAGGAVVVEAPSLPKDSMVLVMSPDPMSFVAAYVDPAVRFIGVFSNMISPGATTGLARLIEDAVRQHQGPLWGLETDEYAEGRAKVLSYYGLHYSEACLPIKTNLAASNLRICRLAPN